MGNNSQNPNSSLKKGQGYRILSVRKKSPLDGQVEIFFDFIIDIVPSNPPQRTPKDILAKLSGQKQKQKPLQKSFTQQIKQYENVQVIFKIVSTKNRSVRNIIATPNNKWNGYQDVIGVQIRKQRYDEAFDTYFPMMEIVNNSPIYRAGIVDGQYLLGCLQTPYVSLSELIDFTYDRFFDKEIVDKTVNLAVYNIGKDQVRIVPLVLKRNWGGKGLLGCQFMQGYLYKFPSSSLQEKRQELLKKQREKEKNLKMREELKQCDGVSKIMVNSLKNSRKVKNGNHLRQIHKLLSVSPPIIEQSLAKQGSNQMRNSQRQVRSHVQGQNGSMRQTRNQEQSNERIEILQRKVKHLEQTLYSIQNYIEMLELKQQERQEKSE